MPLVSVITSTFNCGKFIEQSINSILSQSFTDFEFIIINDGSIDNTKSIVSKVKDSRIRYIDCVNNKGIGVRSNEAIAVSSGKYIAIQDADDVSLDDRLQKEVDYIESNKDIFCVGGHAIVVDKDNRIISKWDHPPETTQEIKVLFTKGKNPIINPTAMFRKKDFMELGRYSEDFKMYTVPDIDLWSRALLSGLKFYNLQFPVIHYRWHNSSISRKYAQEQKKAHLMVLSNFNKIRKKGVIL